MTNAKDGRLVRGEKRRAAILGAAIELFGEKGFHASTLRELSERVGISEAGLLHHFGSKTELLQAVLGLRDELDASVRRDEEERGLSFGATMRSQVSRNSDSPGLVGLHTHVSAEATSPEHPAHSGMLDRYRKLRQQDVDRFQAVVDANDGLRGVSPENLAILTTAVMDGLQVQWLLDPEQVDMESAFADFLRLLGVDEPSEAQAEPE